MAQDAPQDSAGPSSPPPALPEGWLAQWEGVSRKWYYVQRATGKSQWEIPTEPVILTPSTTPTSTGTGPSRAPHSRPQTNSPQAAGGLTVAGTDRGISSFLGSQGNPQHGGGFMQMAAGMLRNQFLHDKPGGYNAQQNQPGQAYGGSSGHGLMGHLSQYQNGSHQQNPFGYASTGQAGVYMGSAPQYQPLGQVAGQAPVPQAHSVPPLNGALPQPAAGFAGNYAMDQSANPSSQFNPSAISSQQYAAQPMMASPLPNQYQASSTHTQFTSGGSMSTVAQPQWQLAQPAVPQATKPSPQSHQASGGSTGQQLYNQQAYPSQQQQQLNQSFTGAQFPSSQYPGSQTMSPYGHSSIGQQFPAQPGDTFGLSGQSSSQNFQGAQVPGLHTSNAYAQNSQYPMYQTGQQGSPFTAGSTSMSAPAATASGYNSPMGAVAFGTPPYPSGTQASSLSPQHSNPSLNGHFGSANSQNNMPGTVTELPDNQVGPGPNQYTVSQAQNGPGPAALAQGPYQPQQQQQAHQYPFGSLNELATGSDASRPTMADPQFVSGPWTSSAGGNVAYVHPEQSRYGKYGGNFR